MFRLFPFKSPPPQSPPTLKTERLILRPLRAEDAASVYRLIDRNRDEFSHWFTWSRTTTFESVRNNLRGARHHMNAGTEWHYGMFLPDGTLVGRVGLSAISKRDRTAELGYWIGRQYAGQGLMTEAGKAFVESAMAGPASTRIDAYADVENRASQRVLQKLGFVRVETVVAAVMHPERGWRNHEHFVRARIMTAGTR